MYSHLLKTVECHLYLSAAFYLLVWLNVIVLSLHRNTEVFINVAVRKCYNVDITIK